MPSGIKRYCLDGRSTESHGPIFPATADRIHPGIGVRQIRLACGLRPESDLSFFQLFMPHAMPANAHASHPHRIGQERYLVSMFADMRGSTRLAENQLPFDTVFIVNRFLGAVSQAVIECGGQPNQFVGDGQLALSGLAADALPQREVTIRGRSEPMIVHIVSDARALSVLVDDVQIAAADSPAVAAV